MHTNNVLDSGLQPLVRCRLRAQAALLQTQGLGKLLHLHDYWLVKQHDVLVDALQACKTLLSEGAVVAADTPFLCEIDDGMLSRYVRTVTKLRQELGWWE
jgi:hypothetical protein